MTKHHRRGRHNIGKELRKPTDYRRQKPDNLQGLTFEQLTKTGRVIEQISTKGKLRYNIVIDGVPRTVMLDAK